MRQPFARLGGKSRLANKIISMFPDYKTYVEPFVGAGSVFYRLPKKENTIEVINDKDKDIYTIHKGLRDMNDFINKNIDRNLSKTEFERIKDKTDPVSLLERYRNSFLGKGKYYAKQNIKTDFSKYKDRLRNVKIYNRDYSNIIKKFDSKDTLFYLDPPYENIKENDYKHYVQPEDILKTVNDIKGKFILSYNDSPNIRKLFSKYNQYKVKTKYVSGVENTLKDITELLITNF